MRNRHSIILEEQQYWKNWTTNNGDEQYPLQPFIYSHSQRVVNQTDNLIRDLDSHENATLFVRVNIDNGILHLIYLTWDNSSDKVDLVEAKGLTGHPSFHTHKKSEFPITTQLANLATKDGFVDVQNPQTLDADSLYLTVQRGSCISRFAAYGPEIDTSGHEDTLALFAQYLLKKLPNPSFSKAGKSLLPRNDNHPTQSVTCLICMSSIK